MACFSNVHNTFHLFCHFTLFWVFKNQENAKGTGPTPNHLCSETLELLV